MNILIYFLGPFLFLNFYLSKASRGEQISRYVFGLIYTFVFVYIFNVDRGMSFLAANLKWIALLQFIFTIMSFENDGKNKKINATRKSLIYLSFIAVFLGSIIFSSSPYIYGGAEKLAKLPNTQESSGQSPQINTENIIIIPPETAYYQMQTLIGALQNPSLYKIGEISLTRTSEGAYYAAPISIEGGLKALLNKELPGVVYVSAERLEDGKIINMPHSHGESLVLGNDLYRYLRQYKKDYILLDVDVELDDDLNPYYVGSYGKFKYGRKAIEVKGVLIYDMKSGEVKDYSKEQAPEWVDQIYTSDVAEKYNSYFGRLQGGFLNSIFGQKGVHVPTVWKSDISLSGFEIDSNQVVPVVGSDGEFYFFTDHTNTSKTSTTMTGYTLMNTRTGEMIYYKTSGYLNGLGAMNSVERLLGADKANWTTSQPILYNLYGVDTWIIPVINRTDGSFVKLGLVTAQSKFAILANNKVELLDAFKRALADGRVNQSADVKVENNLKLQEREVVGIILRINQAVENGQSVFYIKLDTAQDKVFMLNRNISPDIVLAREKDSVAIKYIEMEGQLIIPITELKIDFLKSN
jgi:hypothetical protein